MSPQLLLVNSFSCCASHGWNRDRSYSNTIWWHGQRKEVLFFLSLNCKDSQDSSRPLTRRPGFGQSSTTTKNNNNKNKNINTNSAPPGGLIHPINKFPTTATTDFEFDQRLQAIKRSALEQKKLEQQITTQYGPIDYDQSPPQPNSNKDSPKTIGLGAKIGIGVAVAIFGLVFALGDFLPTTQGDSPSNEAAVVDIQLSAEEKKTLQTRLQQFEAALAASPKDPTAVEGAAVTLTELGEYSRAAFLLEDLTKMKPNDPDAFRLLGEVQYQLKDYEGSAAAYKRSAMVSKTVNFEVLRGLTNSLLAGKRPDEAVQFLLVSRERLSANKMAEGRSPEAESEVVDPVQVELLLGKAYSDWGHVSDAVSVYDQLISTHPDDFRGYLAKGIILKENGRAGDAERMFIQARFFAPEKAKALVDRYSRK